MEGELSRLMVEFVYIMKKRHMPIVVETPLLNVFFTVVQ